MLESNRPIPARRSNDEARLPARPTVIPTPRSNTMFPGWGVRF
jgi:hypothetical protein